MEDTNTGISRRTALKRIGVGAAVVWTAPMVMSMETPAFAGSEACTNCDTTCPRSHNQCAPGHFCLVHVGVGGCVCVFANYCSEAATNGSGTDIVCTSDANCPSGYVCATTCCGNGGQPINLCVLPTDPPTTQTIGWDVGGFYHCTTPADCSQANTGVSGFTTCAPAAGTTWSVCQ